jgi:antitoxin CcdA
MLEPICQLTIGATHMKTDLSRDPELVDEALKVNGESNKQARLTLALRETIARRWIEENRESIAAFNKEIEEQGVWSEGIRSW